MGFCFGVRRAIDILEKIAREHGHVETLGAPVHNQQVLKRLAEIGVRVADSIDSIRGEIVAIGAHGVSPKVEQELQARHARVFNTTCPFVHRAQIAARRLSSAGFFVVVFGDANHPEVRGIIGWADGCGLATVDKDFSLPRGMPRRVGILSQTTQIPANFNEFVKGVIDHTLVKDAEIRVTDTICHDLRQRHQAALDLARRVDLMLVIGSHTSANTKHLTELCATATRTYLVQSAEEIQPSWLLERRHIGVTSGASTADETISEVMTRLEAPGD